MGVVPSCSELGGAGRASTSKLGLPRSSASPATTSRSSRSTLLRVRPRCWLPSARRPARPAY
eukprot:12685949-Alexandrium_andersonii.AAC.1